MKMNEVKWGRIGNLLGHSTHRMVTCCGEGPLTNHAAGTQQIFCGTNVLRLRKTNPPYTFYTMRTIPEKYVKNSWKYRLIKRVENFAIYEQSGNGMAELRYELCRVRSHNGRTIGTSIVAPSEYLPSSEEWGRNGWTCWTLPQAESLLAERLAARRI